MSEEFLSVSSMECKPRDILMLPVEMLKNILIYVDEPSRKNVVLVCHIFHEIICELERDEIPLKLRYSEIYEGDIYDSLLNTERQFCELTINLKGCRSLSNIDRIEAIMKKFGGRIKRFKLLSSVQKETVKVRDSQLIAILKLIPMVEEFNLANVYVLSHISQSSATSNELDLHELRKLILNCCLFDNSLVVDLIPVNVLQELVFTFDSQDESIFQNFFNRQANVKRLDMFENDGISFDHFELEHLKISSSIDFVSMLRKQPKIRYLDFAITWIDGLIFSEVCRLENLEVLRTLIDQVPSTEFKKLNKLKQLKELRLESHTSVDCGHLSALSMMEGMQLEKLTLFYQERKIPEEILVQISNCFLNIKHIELVNHSLKILSTIAEYFPNMESILMDFFTIFHRLDVLEIRDNFRHDNLKQLVVTYINATEVQNKNTVALLKLLDACPNLEKVMLSKLTDVSLNDFEKLMTKHPRLTHLSLEVDDFKFDLDVILVILKLTENLQHLRLGGLTNYPPYSTLRQLFENRFSKITLYKYKTGEGELVMKPKQVQDWYLNFNLRDHF